jgi:MFS family permease
LLCSSHYYDAERAKDETTVECAKEDDYGINPDDTLSLHSEIEAGQPPLEPTPADGGLYGWLTVFGACLVFFDTWGLVQAFGAYQSYYTTGILKDYNASSISWIGTIQAFLLVFVGVITGPVFDQGYLRPMVIVGGCMIVFAVMMLSLAREYWQIVLAQGICLGLGSGILFTPSLAQVTVSFTKHRPIALGCAMIGSGLGGIIYPIVFDQLEPRIGFAWATRVIGFIVLATLTPAVAILAWKATPKKPPRSLFDWSALREPPYITYGIATFLMFTAYWVPWFYIPLYGRFGVDASASFSFYLLSITNACSIVSRLSTPIFQRWLTSIQMLFIMCILGGILVWTWLGITTFGGFVTFCVFWGMFSGPMAVLPAAAVAELSASLNVVGARMGMIWASSAVGILIGSPIAGAVSDPTQGDFLGGQVYSGACLFAAAVLIGVTVWLIHKAAKAKHSKPAG